MWKFVVDDASKVDVQRICDEVAAEGSDAFVVTSGGNAMVGLSDEFLSRYHANDHLEVAGLLLRHNWGTKWVVASQVTPDAVGFHSDGRRALNGWQVRFISVSQIEQTIKEIHQVRSYQRRLVVKVHPL